MWRGSAAAAGTSIITFARALGCARRREGVRVGVSSGGKRTIEGGGSGSTEVKSYHQTQSQPPTTLRWHTYAGTHDEHASGGGEEGEKAEGRIARASGKREGNFRLGRCLRSSFTPRPRDASST